MEGYRRVLSGYCCDASECWPTAFWYANGKRLAYWSWGDTSAVHGEVHNPVCRLIHTGVHSHIIWEIKRRLENRQEGKS